MALIKSISGIRGTIGGPTGDTLNPLDIVKFTTAYAKFIRQSDPTGSNCIVVGRDARISGDMVRLVVCPGRAGQRSARGVLPPPGKLHFPDGILHPRGARHGTLYQEMIHFSSPST